MIYNRAMHTPRSAFWAGVRAEIPILLGAAPFGLIYGTLAINAGIPPGWAQAMSALVFAGSAQFVIAQLVAAGAPALVLIVSAILVNLRHMLYSASVAPYINHLARPWHWLLAYLLTDEAYAVAITEYEQGAPSPHKHWYFLGAGLALWGSWQASTALGISFGRFVSADWSLDFTLPLTFIALVVPALNTRPKQWAALVAGTSAVLVASLPWNLGLIVATLLGITVGVIIERRQPPTS